MSEVLSFVQQLSGIILKLESRIGTDNGRKVKAPSMDVLKDHDTMGIDEKSCSSEGTEYSRGESSEDRMHTPTRDCEMIMSSESGDEPIKKTRSKRTPWVKRKDPVRYFPLPHPDSYNRFKSTLPAIKSWDGEGIHHGQIRLRNGKTEIGELGFWKRASPESRLEMDGDKLVFVMPEQQNTAPIRRERSSSRDIRSSDQFHVAAPFIDSDSDSSSEGERRRQPQRGRSPRFRELPMNAPTKPSQASRPSAKEAIIPSLKRSNKRDRAKEQASKGMRAKGRVPAKMKAVDPRRKIKTSIGNLHPHSASHRITEKFSEENGTRRQAKVKGKKGEKKKDVPSTKAIKKKGKRSFKVA